MMEPDKEKNILRFVFEEMKDEEASSFLSELCSDDELWDSYEEVDSHVEALQGCEVEPSQESLDNVMAYVRSSKKPSNIWDKINLHAVLATAMLIFVLAGVAGSVYKVRRSQGLSPDRHNVSQKLDPKLEWEPRHIDKNLEDIRSDIHDLIKGDKL